MLEALSTGTTTHLPRIMNWVAATPGSLNTDVAFVLFELSSLLIRYLNRWSHSFNRFVLSIFWYSPPKSP